MRQINSDTCLKELKKIIKQINEQYPIPIVLDKRIQIGNGQCPNIFNNDSKIVIGVMEVSKKLLHPSHNVDISYLTKSIVSIYHEARHYVQIAESFNKLKNFDADDIYMLTNHIATIGAYNGYYNPSNGGIRNYMRTPKEIDAEWQGIIDAHDYLKDMYDEKQADELILDYVNSKVGAYFISTYKTYTTVDEIDESFYNAFENSKKEEYKKVYVCNIASNNDESMQYGLSLNDKFLDEFMNIDSPIVQDKILAGIYIKYLEETKDTYLDDNYKLLSVCKEDISHTTNEFLINISNDYNNTISIDKYSLNELCKE